MSNFTDCDGKDGEGTGILENQGGCEVTDESTQNKEGKLSSDCNIMHEQ